MAQFIHTHNSTFPFIGKKTRENDEKNINISVSGKDKEIFSTCHILI